MGIICSSICSSPIDDDSEDRITLIGEYVVKERHKSFVEEMLESDQFTEYIDRSKFCFYFGVNLKLQEWHHKNWERVDLDPKRNSFAREKINEAVIPKLKFLIRKGVPLDMMRKLILNLFGLTNIDTKLEYRIAKDQFKDALKEFLSLSPIIGTKVKIDSILNHHCLNAEGLKVGKGYS